MPDCRGYACRFREINGSVGNFCADKRIGMVHRIVPSKPHVCLKTGQLLEGKNLTDQLHFRQYRSDACTLWENEQELDYLGQCKTLMRKAAPTDAEIAQLEGLWLEAHPKNHAVWLANHASIREDTVRWLLAPNRIPNRNTLLPLWFGEMVKGMTLGTPDVAERCAGELAEFERYPAL